MDKPGGVFWIDEWSGRAQHILDGGTLGRVGGHGDTGKQAEQDVGSKPVRSTLPRFLLQLLPQPWMRDL